MNNAYNAFGLQAMGLQSLGLAPYGLNALGQQAHALNPIGMQQAALNPWPHPEALAAMQNYWANHPQSKESRAQRMAKEIRDNNPSMQVQRRTRRET